MYQYILYILCLLYVIHIFIMCINVYMYNIICSQDKHNICLEKLNSSYFIYNVHI